MLDPYRFGFFSLDDRWTSESYTSRGLLWSIKRLDPTEDPEWDLLDRSARSFYREFVVAVWNKFRSTKRIDF